MAGGPPGVPDASLPDAALVRAELESILASDLFVRSDRLSAFLKFIVDESLAGRVQTLKEPVIAMAVYGRHADFSGAADPIVRVDARRLRDKLREYYAAAPQSRVVISVPKGSYAPVVHVGTGPAFPAADASRGPVRSRATVGRRRFMAVVMLAVVLAAAALFAWYASRSPGDVPVAADIGSLAVLPLEDLSRDRTQAFFADGLTEALITRLAGAAGLEVISRTSVLRFRDGAPPVPEIARLLGVQALIEGAVLRDGSRVRVTVRLVNGADGRSLWAQTYERELGDVLALHSEIAQGIADRVAVTLTEGERTRLARADPVRPEAYEHYLKGRFAARRATRAGLEEAAGHYQNAIAADASFAAAHAGLAQAYNYLASMLVGAAPPSEMRPKAIAAAARARELDPDLAEAHAELAFAWMRDWRWDEAGAAFRRAIELRPNDAEILAPYSDYMGALGRVDEAMAMARRAVALDPLSPWVQDNVGLQLYLARRYGDAIQHLGSIVDVDPALANATRLLGMAHVERQEFDLAIDALQRSAALSERSSITLGLLTNVLARAGRQAEARQTLNELEMRSRAGYVPTLALVWAHTGLGDRDAAFFWLERAYQERSNLLAFLKVGPLLDPLRGDPRFDDLLRRVNLATPRLTVD